MMSFLDIVKKVADLISTLTDFAQRFRGFLAWIAFLVLTGMTLFTFLFSQGSFDGLIDNFGRLSADQFYNLILVAVFLIFSMTLSLILLSYLKETTPRRYLDHMHVVVHEAGDPTEPVGGATVTLMLNQAVVDTTNEGGGATLPFERMWRNRECSINARHDDYAARDPVLVKLQPQKRIFIPLHPKEETVIMSVSQPEPSDAVTRVFISASPFDADSAQSLAALLQENDFQVSTPLQARDTAELDLETEQAIRRADVVVMLLSAVAASAEALRGEILFAQEMEKPIVPVRLSPEADAISELNTVLPVDLPEGWQSEVGDLLDYLQEVGMSDNRAIAGPPPTPPVEPVIPNANPFIAGGVVRDDLFVGRAAPLRLIGGRIGGELQSVSVVANRRMGKTSLLNYIAKRYETLFRSDHTWVVAYMDMMDVRAHSIAGVMRMLRRGIASQLGRDLWDEKYDGDLMVMAEEFEALADTQVRLVLCLDEWESVMAHPELDDLIEQLRASGSMSRIGMIVATAHELNELTERGGLSSPFYNIFETTYLGLMPDSEWRLVVRNAFNRSGLAARNNEYTLIGDLAGGHPLLTQIAGSLVWDARFREEWDEAHIREQYAQKAEMTFRSIWQSQTARQKQVIREVITEGIPSAAAREIVNGLRRRGVLTPAGAVFCQPFADFVYFYDAGCETTS